LKILRSTLLLPTPNSIRVFWNFGSLLGLSIGVQIVTGLFLAIHYSFDPGFTGIIHIIRDVPGGWFLRLVHANGARVYFIIIYVHFGRALYYQSWVTQPNSFLAGVTIILLRIGTAFLGYVLPWGQIRFWGATVITNLISAIPYIGPSIVRWVWGGFTVSSYTLRRFYVIHFLLPFIVVGFILIHLYFLHSKGRTNPLGNLDNQRKIPFHPYFSYKDGVGFAIFGVLLIYFVRFRSYRIIDPENFIEANRIVTPVHIQPEWYFLFAYAILRCIPSKVGGVLGLVAAVTIFYIFPVLSRKNVPSSFSPLQQCKFWLLVITFFVLTFLGAIPVEDPFPIIRAIFSVIYFSLCLLLI